MNCVRYRLAAVAAALDDRLAARPINVMGCHEFYKHIKRFVIARVEKESQIIIKEEAAQLITQLISLSVASRGYTHLAASTSLMSRR